MKWSYILLFSEQFMSYDEAKYFLNARDDVTEWLHVFDNVFVLASTNTAVNLAAAVLAYVKKNQKIKKPTGLFLLTELTEDRNGWLQKAAWNLINHQTTTPSEPVLAIESGSKSADDEEEIPF
jgi:hypothetical protein